MSRVILAVMLAMATAGCPPDDDGECRSDADCGIGCYEHQRCEQGICRLRPADCEGPW